MNFTDLLKRAQEYFNLAPDKENERQTIELISSGVSFRGATLWVLMLAILIASLGLNVNSTAVIIGAMLISPLMGPIIGMGLAIGINDLGLLRRSLKNYAVATLISVLTATVFRSQTRTIPESVFFYLRNSGNGNTLNLTPRGAQCRY